MVRGIEREAIPLPTRLHLHRDTHTDGDTMKEWANTIALVILAVVLAVIGLWFNSRLDAQQRQMAQSSAQFQVFLQGFTAENDYECRVLWFENEHNPNIPYHPLISVCNVAAP